MHTESELSPKQRTYIDGCLKGKTKKQAALDAGYTKQMAKKPPRKIETATVRQAFAELLDKAGISNDLVAQRVKELLDATEN